MPDPIRTAPAFPRAPLLVAALILLIATVFYGTLLPQGTISHNDEYLTLDRSAAMLAHGDPWVIYSNNAPSFKKPPLQYWVTAALLGTGMDLEAALRLPSFAFGLLLIAAVGWLAHILLPKDPWAVPAAMFLMVSSSRFWESALAALLDTGAILLMMLALIGTLLALRNPRWWYLVALACGLGALQKVPAGLGVVIATLLTLACTTRWHDVALRQALANRHFLAAALLTVALMAWWPLVQWLRFGNAYFEVAIGREMLDRFAPTTVDSDPDHSLFSMITHREPTLRVLGALALLWLPWCLRRPDLVVLPLLFIGFAVAIATASGYVSPRYSLYMVPLFAAALAAVLLTTFRNRWLQLGLLVLISAASYGPLKGGKALGLMKSDQTQYLPLLQDVSASLLNADALIFCNRPAPDLIRAGALSFYGSAGKPIVKIDSVADLDGLVKAGQVAPPYVGLCAEEVFQTLAPHLQGLQVQSTREGFVHWTAEGFRATAP